MMETDHTLEIIALEQLFAEESRCEMKHQKTACSSAVTHVAVDCRRQFLICGVAFNIITKMMEQNPECVHCQKPATACWNLVKA